MWIPARQLVARLRQPRSRAAERAELARRLRQERREAYSSEERALARRLRQRREQICRALAEVHSCAGCAQGCEFPEGAFAGGACCGTETHRVFSDDEVGALAAAATGPRNLPMPQGTHAGCAFRGPEGCSLEPSHRPNVCVRYVCAELARELFAKGRLAEIEDWSAEMERDFERFVALRSARRHRQWLAEIHPALGAEEE